MKHNDWTEQMRRRLGNAEADVPDGLWDAIEQKLDAQSAPTPPETTAPTVNTESAHRRVALRRWAVAASVALVAGAALWWHAAGLNDTLPGGAKRLGVVAYDNADSHTRNSSDKNGHDNNNNFKKTNASASVCLGLARRADGGAGDMMVAASDDRQKPVAFNENCGDTEGRANGVDGPHKDAEGHDKNGDSQGKSLKRQSDIEEKSGVKRQPVTAMLRSEQQGRSRRHDATEGTRWQLGVGTSGNMTRYSSTSGIMPVSYSAPNYSEAASNVLFCAEPMQRDCKEKTRHNMPVSFGATVAYGITDRLALSTGAVYTLATSSFEHGTSNNVTKDEQTLHYIGIPLNASYTVWGNRLLKAYITAGGQADFNVSAKVETGGHTTDIGKDRVQFSVGGAAGLQLNVIRQMGIYVEPGVKYYFDNGSSVQNVFKEHPCNFSLQVGLRYEIK